MGVWCHRVKGRDERQKRPSFSLSVCPSFLDVCLGRICPAAAYSPCSVERLSVCFRCRLCRLACPQPCKRKPRKQTREKRQRKHHEVASRADISCTPSRPLILSLPPCNLLLLILTPLPPARCMLACQQAARIGGIELPNADSKRRGLSYQQEGAPASGSVFWCQSPARVARAACIAKGARRMHPPLPKIAAGGRGVTNGWPHHAAGGCGTWRWRRLIGWCAALTRRAPPLLATHCSAGG